MVDLSKCGLDLKIQAVDLVNKAIEESMKELSASTGGIADNIATLKVQLQTDFNTARVQLDVLIPEIPDLPPNLPKMMAVLAALASDPTKIAELALQSAQIRLVFGGATTTIDLETLLNNPKALLTMNLCKAIPNIDAEAVTDALGNVSYTYTEKGLPPTAPVEDAKKPPDPPAPKAVETVTPEPDPTVPAKPTPEEAEEAESYSPPPAQPVKKPKETKTVDFNDTWKAYIKAKKDAGKVVHDYETKPYVFTKVTNYRSAEIERGAAWWKPALWPTQVNFESAMLTNVHNTLQAAWSMKKHYESRDFPGAAEKGALEDALYNAAAAVFQNARSLPNGGKWYKLNKKTGDITITMAQAMDSGLPKPEGSAGAFSILA